MRRRAREPVVTTWWGERWLATVERATGPGRLARGLSYARAGRVDGMTVEPGRISATVQGSRPTPYRVDVRVPALEETVWPRLAAALGGAAGPAAALVAGVLPEAAEAAFAAVGAPLFPAPEERVAVGCTCPDWNRPCKHAAAVCYAFAARLDRDPFVLFALRGRGREELLADLRVARQRAAARLGAAPDDAPSPGGAVPTLLDELAPAVGRFWSLGPTAGGEWPAAAPADAGGAGLRRLGMPPRALGGVELKLELALAYRLLSEQARSALDPAD